MIKQVTLALGMVPIAAWVSIPFVGTAIDDGRFVPTDIMVESAYATLADLRPMLAAMAHLPR